MLQSFYDTVSLIGSLILIVLILVGTYYATRWYARRMQTTGTGRHIKVLERTPMGQRSSLVIVRVAGKNLLIGVGEKDIHMLCELPDLEDELSFGEQQDVPVPKAFRDLLEKARERSARRGVGKKEDDEESK